MTAHDLFLFAIGVNAGSLIMLAAHLAHDAAAVRRAHKQLAAARRRASL